MVRRAKVVCF